MEVEIQRHVDSLEEHCDETETVLGMLEDEESRGQYWRELAFNRLHPLLRDEEYVNRLAGNVKSGHWNAVLERTRDLRNAGRLPQLEFPTSMEALAPAMYASIFVLGRYAHTEVEVPKGGVFLDCGAGYGDVTVWALLAGAGTVLAFEPETSAMPFLARNAATYGQGRAQALLLGLGHKKGSLVRDPRLAGSLAPGVDARNAVAVVTLDEWLRERSIVPDFIKLNVDGFTSMAIVGGQRTIATHRPPMAVALDHELLDLWNVPLLLKRIVPQYRFWCRKCAKTTGFTLYART
jgi:FkbM family methyltransferase